MCPEWLMAFQRWASVENTWLLAVWALPARWCLTPYPIPHPFSEPYSIHDAHSPLDPPLPPQSLNLYPQGWGMKWSWGMGWGCLFCTLLGNKKKVAERFIGLFCRVLQKPPPPRPGHVKMASPKSSQPQNSWSMQACQNATRPPLWQNEKSI